MNIKKSIKRSIRSAAGAASECWLFRALSAKAALSSVNIVYFHYVGSPMAHYKAFYEGCTSDRFDQDLQLLKTVFDFRRLDEVIYCSDTQVTNKKPTLAFSFDDGLNLKTTRALEILDKYKIKATTFVITSCIGNTHLMWRHKLSAIYALANGKEIVRHYNGIATESGLRGIRNHHELMSTSRRWPQGKKDVLAAELWGRCGMPPIEVYLAESRPYFGWNDLQEWIQNGHSVGFHTHTHPDCSTLNREDLAGELIAPARELKERLGLDRLHFSYPFGQRLGAELETEIFATGIFSSLLGTRGFQPRGTPLCQLERACAEAPPIGWSVFRPLALKMLTGFPAITPFSRAT